MITENEISKLKTMILYRESNAPDFWELLEAALESRETYKGYSKALVNKFEFLRDEIQDVVEYDETHFDDD